MQNQTTDAPGASGGAADAALTLSQRAAVSHGDGPALILAGPGSGKTLVITHRIRYLIREMKVPPEDILVITFSRAAADEMRSRFRNLPAEDCFGPDPEGKVSFGTFHAVFFQILRLSWHYRTSDLLREEERFAVLEHLLNRSGYAWNQDSEILSGISSEISMLKNERIDPEFFYSSICPDRVFRFVFEGYRQWLEKEHRLDFDDLLLKCHELLSSYPAILAKWQQRFKYILTDEFQDINSLQYQVLRMLAAPQNQLFAVGDDDQSIYRFRGAKPSIMLGFTKDYPAASVYVLEENFRCAPVITSSALKVIGENRKRFPKQIRPVRKNPRNEKERVVIHGFQDLGDEGKALAEEILRELKAGTAPEQIAVLSRTKSACGYFAEVLMRYGIDFSIRDVMPSLADHWITRDLTAYLRLATGERLRSDFLRIMNRPLRYLSRSCTEEGETFSFDHIRSYYQAQDWMAERADLMEKHLIRMSELAPYAAVNYIRSAVGYEAWIEDYAREKGIRSEELIRVLDELQESASLYRTWEEWIRGMEESRSRIRKDTREGVVLSTLHASKGLEFDTVFLPDLNEGVLPYRKARLEEDLEEERRLFYVGMTRARYRLFLWYLHGRNGKRQIPSSFLKPLVTDGI